MQRCLFTEGHLLLAKVKLSYASVWKHVKPLYHTGGSVPRNLNIKMCTVIPLLNSGLKFACISGSGVSHLPLEGGLQPINVTVVNHVLNKDICGDS